MASQEQIVNNLNFVRRAITTQQNILNAELSLPVSQQDPAKIRRLQTQIETDKKTFASLENQLKNITTTSSTASPSAAPKTAEVQPKSQDQIEKQINQVDREITSLKRELNNTSPRNLSKRKELQAEIEKKELERKKLENDLLNVTTAKPYEVTGTGPLQPAGTFNQNNIKKRLTDIDAEIAKLQNQLNRTSPRGSISVVNELKAKIAALEKEKKEYQSLERGLFQADQYAFPRPIINPNASQADIQNQINLIDAELLKLEAQLKDPKNKNNFALLSKLAREITALKDQRNALVAQLANLQRTTPPVTRPSSPPSAPAPAANPTPNPTNNGLQGNVERTRSTAISEQNQELLDDWRVRLYLAPGGTYLYNDLNNVLLSPLRKTNGIIFPYTPAISVSHTAQYDSQDITHSNYKLYFYKGSAVENISITAEFTAQDTNEANYLLAVIHFLKSATKMFYGQDKYPVAGTPPPICYLDGFGTYQYNKHPLLINSFTYSLPTDVDYIRAAPVLALPPGTPQLSSNEIRSNESPTDSRLNTDKILSGGAPPNPNFTKVNTQAIPTYVPTKIQLVISALAVVSRKDISDNFSVTEYAKGTLTQGRTNRKIGAGIW